MSAAPIANSAASDSGNEVDTAKIMVPTPNSATAKNILRPARLRKRPARERKRHQQRARSRHGAHQAKAPGPDLENILGIDRQQRGRAGKQHREHVERGGAEDQRIFPDEVDAGEQRGEVDLLALRRHLLDPNERDQDRRRR